jgi:malonate-semialdehyde dehydrogenase (acetylating)/methylmalonate-semialdehyde dehydrogenase
MVPMWMIPIALVLGNAFVWKPSEKVPLTSLRLAEALREAGLPEGVFTVVQGGRTAVEALCDHPGVAAIGFVGSTAVAKQVYLRATTQGKRALTLGGAKNHLILLPDADPEIAVDGVVASYTGCAGQRCMAGSVLVGVGDVDSLLEKIRERSGQLRAGLDYGAIISGDSLSKLRTAIQAAQQSGAELRVDGRETSVPAGCEKGFWLAPTVLDRVAPGSPAATEELFGPVLSIVRVKTLSEALELQAANPYGNAVSVFTRSGAAAEEVARRGHAGMIGINVGVPVPREPFSFGGLYESKFGHGDITGYGGIEFWSNLKKVTTKWSFQKDASWMS